MNSGVCDPIKTIENLLSPNCHESYGWCNLIEPLVQRSLPRFLKRKYYSIDHVSSMNKKESMRPEVIVCHDYKGNYLDDKFINGTDKYEEYRFYNWNCIDVFCYFSYNIVSIPTLQWLNAAHKNGVKVMGTFNIKYPEEQNALYTQVLSSEDQAVQVARALVDLLKLLKLDGWFIDIQVFVDKKQIPTLKHFLGCLTRLTHHEVPNAKILWNDSVTQDGSLIYQNELNVKNE